MTKFILSSSDPAGQIRLEMLLYLTVSLELRAKAAVLKQSEGAPFYFRLLAQFGSTRVLRDHVIFIYFLDMPRH